MVVRGRRGLAPCTSALLEWRSDPSGIDAAGTRHGAVATGRHSRHGRGGLVLISARSVFPIQVHGAEPLRHNDRRTSKVRRIWPPHRKLACSAEHSRPSAGTRSAADRGSTADCAGNPRPGSRRRLWAVGGDLSAILCNRRSVRRQIAAEHPRAAPSRGIESDDRGESLASRWGIPHRTDAEEGDCAQLPLPNRLLDSTACGYGAVEPPPAKPRRHCKPMPLDGRQSFVTRRISPLRGQVVHLGASLVGRVLRSATQGRRKRALSTRDHDPRDIVRPPAITQDAGIRRGAAPRRLRRTIVPIAR